MNEISADNTRAILKALQRSKSPCLLVLRAYPHGRRGYAHKPFAVRVYSSRSADINETVFAGERNSHFLGCYTGEVTVEDLAEDIAMMIAEKYRATVDG